MKVEVEYKNVHRQGREHFIGSRKEILEAIDTLEASGYEIGALEEVDESVDGGLLSHISGRLVGNKNGGQARQRRSRR